MTHVAKLVIVDSKDQYLMMYRSEHPTFGEDPDLPGGTLEDGEQPVETMIREVYEEAGITVDKGAVSELYSGDDYSSHGTIYTLYLCRVPVQPNITMSWEHSSYEWIDLKTFLNVSESAKDTYMHMVFDVINNKNNKNLL